MSVPGCFEPVPAKESEQRRFERAVLAVMHHVAATGERIDRAAAALLTRHFSASSADHLLADLIICVSDGLRLLGEDRDGRPSTEAVLARFSRWQSLPEEPLAMPGQGRTRIQACIRSLRLADSGDDVGKS